MRDYKIAKDKTKHYKIRLKLIKNLGRKLGKNIWRNKEKTEGIICYKDRR